MHNLFKNPARVDAEGTGRRRRRVISQNLDLWWQCFANQLRRRGGREELYHWKGTLEIMNPPPLPLRVKVQIQFIDRHNPGCAVQSILLKMRVQSDGPPCKVPDQ